MIDEKISSVMLQPPSKGRAHNAHYHLALGRGQCRNQLAALDARYLAEVAASLPVRPLRSVSESPCHPASVSLGARCLNRSYLDGQTVAPAIFAIRDHLHLIPKLPLLSIVEQPCDCLYVVHPEPDADIRVAPDVLDPTGGFAMFGEKVELLVVDDEPNLDFALPSGHPTGCGQMKHLLIRQALECCGTHNGIAEDTAL